MLKDLFRNYIYPIAVFCGGMIGVGFLSLPYIAMQSGIWLVLLYFLVITALVIIIDLIFCEISLKTPDFKRFPGFVGHYLGIWGKTFAMVSIILGTLGVLLVYLIVGGKFLTTALEPLFSGGTILYVFVYFLLASAIIYFDIKVIARVEFWVIALLFISLFFVFAEGFSQIKLGNIFTAGSGGFNNLFLPYGPFLFAFWGIGLIPEVEEMLIGRKGNLKKVITISTIITSVFYLLFVFLVLGITGDKTDAMALVGLKDFLPNIVISASLLIGALATFTAFITQGLIFKKTLMFDLKVKHWQAFIMTCCPPLILFLLLLEADSFITALSFVGGVLLGINGILILLMYKKIGGKNAIIYPLSLVFLAGIIYEIIYFIK